MSRPFTWAMRSPVALPMSGSNFSGVRNGDPERLFNNIVPIQLQISATEERKSYVRLSIELLPNGLSSSSFRKDLHLEITDEDDPYLFYTLRMSEDDFSILKAQQGLLIDYSSFPAKFIQLVERCIAEQESDCPKFLILLRPQSEGTKSYTVFEVVETNPFKHLCHLSLKISEGNENQIKKHLSVKLRQLKEECENNVQAIQALEHQLELERKNSAQKMAELDLVRSDFQSKLQDMQQRLKMEHQSDRHTLQQSLQDMELQCKQLELNAASKEKILLQQIKELKDTQHSLESQIKETANRLDKAEEECIRLQQELATARKRGASLDADFHHKERAVHQLKTKLAVAEQGLKDKDALLAKQQELLSAAQEQKNRLSMSVEEKDNTIARREAAVKAITEELVKANDIIRKLQTDIRTLNQKLKTRTDVATEQEKLLEQKENEISELRAELATTTKLREELAQLRSKHDEREMTIKSNEQIISYLNKQLNDLQLRSDKPVTNQQPWFSTPNEGGGGGSPNIPLSTIKPVPLQLGQSNRENDEPLDPKYFQPKTYGGIVRKEKSKDKNSANTKPSAYFRTPK